MHERLFSIQHMDDLIDMCQVISPHLNAPMIIGLSGDMGSGKTTFVRTMCEVLKSSDWVNSPTYSIMQHYSSPQFDILHVDLYRLSNDIEIDQLDIPTYMKPNTIAFIEWIDKTNRLNPDALIHITTIDESRRDIRITSNQSWITTIK
ncbi:tRNA (adenosine(37)-N6)-threonylcarbamoyltransferase complex ATPase subunit type 1 TsaE [Candidatus Marinamargulisbacteria bacterium SCGC AG-343-K17]|nr:tRNA (adenosine(37)-N6)-threonylcarbamoyltransferase complex ATPase subunit type 1 TsaE [Candidatus Marinamargulisbacteria bacterium SCGC AG-343-K17]